MGEVLSYEKLAGAANQEELAKQEAEEKKRAEEEAKEIFKNFGPYKELFESEPWKKVADLMKDDAFNNLHHTEDGVWYHRSWGIKMFINCIKERSEAYDGAVKLLTGGEG